MASVGTDKEPEIVAIETPTHFEEGFTLKSILGALFIALFMLPGGMYLGLVAGQGVGDAAQWVTIVLFAEVARRSYQPLRKQEIYILFYIAAALTSAVNLGRGLAGGPFANLVWNAYFISSVPARPIADQIPTWAIPRPDSPAILSRELWHPDWLKPILLLVGTELAGRLSWMGMGYTLFRMTSDVEKLPFPFAAVAASGATALSEAGSESWRWSIFSTGTVIGLMFGAVYVAIPVITGTIFGTPVTVLPIPFADYTTNIENFLPGAILGLSFSLGNVLFGFVLPFEIVLGAAIASVLSMVVVNPVLVSNGLIPTYRPGAGAIATKTMVDMDFWLSIGIGINIAIALIGIALVVKAAMAARQNRRDRELALSIPQGRGDFPIGYALGAWLVSTVGMVALCHYLVPDFPLWILVFFGLVWSPINSYISARMIGLTGRGIGFPYLREASVVATGYQRVDIWYAPMPLADHGWAAQRFREVELTGTKFSSVLKAEALMLPLILLASFFFWSFFWNTNALPSAMFPFAQRFWPLSATFDSVFLQINQPRPDGQTNWFLRAIRADYIAYGTAGGMLAYFLASLLKVPMLGFYGFIGGFGVLPMDTIPQLIGAIFGRRVLRKRYGAENWVRYAPVLLAGFSCGTGLVAMVAIALALIARAVAKLPY